MHSIGDHGSGEMPRWEGYQRPGPTQLSGLTGIGHRQAHEADEPYSQSMRRIFEATTPLGGKLAATRVQLAVILEFALAPCLRISRREGWSLRARPSWGDRERCLDTIRYNE